MCIGRVLHLWWPFENVLKPRVTSESVTCVLFGWNLELPCGCLDVVVADISKSSSSREKALSSFSKFHLSCLNDKAMPLSYLGEYFLKNRTLSTTTDSSSVQAQNYQETLISDLPLVETGEGDERKRNHKELKKMELGETIDRKPFANLKGQSAKPNDMSSAEEDKGLLRATIGGKVFSILVEGSLYQDSSNNVVSEIPSKVNFYFEGHGQHPQVQVVIYDKPHPGKNYYAFSQFCNLSNPREASKKLPEVSQMELPTLLTEIPVHVSININLVQILKRINAAFFFKSFQKSKRAVSFPKRAIATLFAFVFTTLYCVSSSFLSLFSQRSCAASWLPLTATWHILVCRLEEIQFWPIACSDYQLKLTDESFSPDVASSYSSKIARNSPWVSLFVDTILGLTAGALLLLHRNSVSNWLQTTAQALTDNFLRTGVALLMDEPAGLKLNKELSIFLGTISWQGIEIGAWVGGFLSSYIVPGVSFLGILSPVVGFSGFLTLLADLVSLVTCLVAILYWLLSVLYYYQLRAVASLWRFFVGRKWNPLQKRIDSFSASVEQIVIASLLFATSVLLLPTSAMFYLFFATLYSVRQSFLATFYIAAIAIKCFPFYSTTLYLVNRDVFLSGIYFYPLDLHPELEPENEKEEKKKEGREELTQELSSVDEKTKEVISGFYGQGRECKSDLTFLKEERRIGGAENNISYLGMRSDVIKRGELLSPFWDHLGSYFSATGIFSAAYQIASGKRISMSIDLSQLRKDLNLNISVKEYFWMCFRMFIRDEEYLANVAIK